MTARLVSVVEAFDRRNGSRAFLVPVAWLEESHPLTSAPVLRIL